MRLFEARVGRRPHLTHSSGVRSMRVAGTEHWQTFFHLLVDANKAWAKNAAVLVVFISRSSSIPMTNRQSPIRTLRSRMEERRFAGFHQGLVVHGMEGFDYDRARAELRIPDDFQVEAMAAVGRPGPKELLPKAAAREVRMIDVKSRKASLRGRSNELVSALAKPVRKPTPHSGGISSTPRH